MKESYKIKDGKNLIQFFKDRILVILFYDNINKKDYDKSEEMQVEGYRFILNNLLSLIELSEVTMWSTSDPFITTYYLDPFNCYISYADYKGSMGEVSHTLIYDTTLFYNNMLKKKCELNEEGKKMVLDEIKSVFEL